MNTETLATKETNIDNLTITYTLYANYMGISGQCNFDENWKRSQQGHIGGVTIQSIHGSWIPLNCSLAELSRDYHKRGVVNAPKEAYQSLLRQYERDKEAFEVALVVTVSKNGVELFQDTVVRSDYHYDDYDYNHDKALYAYAAYADEDTYISEAKATLKALID